MIHPLDDLTAYLDGALSPSDRERVAAHLASCGSCRTEHDRIASALAQLAQLPPPPAPSATFEQRFYARLATERAERAERRTFLDRLAWRWFGPGLAGAAAAAVMIYAGARHRADERFLADHLELFESYQAVASLDAVEGPEDLQVVAHLDELREGRP